MAFSFLHAFLCLRGWHLLAPREALNVAPVACSVLLPWSHAWDLMAHFAPTACWGLLPLSRARDFAPVASKEIGNVRRTGIVPAAAVWFPRLK